jgi:hypothetical protein
VFNDFLEFSESKPTLGFDAFNLIGNSLVAGGGAAVYTGICFVSIYMSY